MFFQHRRTVSYLFFILFAHDLSVWARDIKFELTRLSSTDKRLYRKDEHTIIAMGISYSGKTVCTEQAMFNPDEVEAYEVVGKNDVLVLLCTSTNDGMENSITVFKKGAKPRTKRLNAPSSSFRIDDKDLKEIAETLAVAQEDMAQAKQEGGLTVQITIEIKLNETKVLKNGLKITLTDVFDEESSGPDGTGVLLTTVHLTLTAAGKSENVVLTYKGQSSSSRKWQDYKVKVVRASGLRKKDPVILNVMGP